MMGLLMEFRMSEGRASTHNPTAAAPPHKRETERTSKESRSKSRPHEHQKKPASRWTRHQDRFVLVQKDEEFRPPEERPVVGRTEDGRALWIAAKFKHPDWSETAFAFVMEEEEQRRFMLPFGNKEPAFVLNLLRQVAQIGKLGSYADQSLIEFYFATIAGMKPRDPTETMLAAQMAALQPLITRTANQLAHAESPQDAESAARTLNKLSRTFSNLAATFDRHRMFGQQKFTMQQISLSVTGNPVESNASSPDTEELMHTSTRQIPEVATIKLQSPGEELSNNRNDGVLVERARHKKDGG
jgi:hypothetical protein